MTIITCAQLDKVIPENFFDEELEVEREFLDFARSLEEGGLDKLTVTKVRHDYLPRRT